VYHPVKLDLTEKIPEIFPPVDHMNTIMNPSSEYIVTKINCSWNKTISLTDIIISDVRSLENVSSHTIQSSIKTLSHAWYGKDVEPPYIEAISKYFSVNTMRKHTVPSRSKHSRKHGRKSPTTKRKIY
jgi:hypothetical protein